MNGRFSRQPCSSSVARISSPLLTSTHSPAFRFKEFWQPISGWAFSLLVAFFLDAHWRGDSRNFSIFPLALNVHLDQRGLRRATLAPRVQTYDPPVRNR